MERCTAYTCFLKQLRVNISPTEPILTMYRLQINFSYLAQFPIIRFRFEQIPYFPLDKCILSS